MAGETLIRRGRAGADLDLGCLDVSSELSAWTHIMTHTEVLLQHILGARLLLLGARLKRVY